MCSAAPSLPGCTTTWCSVYVLIFSLHLCRVYVCMLTLSARQAAQCMHRSAKGLNPSRQDASSGLGHSRPGRLHPRWLCFPVMADTALVYMLSGCINFTTPHSKRDREGSLIAFIGPFRPKPPQTLFIGICCCWWRWRWSLKCSSHSEVRKLSRGLPQQHLNYFHPHPFIHSFILMLQSWNLWEKKSRTHTPQNRNGRKKCDEWVNGAEVSTIESSGESA